MVENISIEELFIIRNESVYSQILVKKQGDQANHFDWFINTPSIRIFKVNLITGVNNKNESIYQYIPKYKRHGGNLYLHLRCKKQPRKRYGTTNTQGQLVNRVPIDE